MGNVTSINKNGTFSRNCHAVLVSGSSVFKILGVPQLIKGTSKILGEAVYNHIINWNISNRIQSMF